MELESQHNISRLEVIFIEIKISQCDPNTTQKNINRMFLKKTKYRQNCEDFLYGPVVTDGHKQWYIPVYIYVLSM